MKKRLISCSAKAYRILSLLLVMLFLFIAVIQLVHSHRMGFIGNGNKTTKDVSAIEKCEICDFIIHKKSKHILDYVASNTLIQLPVKIAYHCNSCICNYDFILQGFTNKGPPLHYS